ncbi:hypothetical protein HanPI659440_Chr15g0611421 [Helianthus annuus]|nr:hypothetical protein HanPI659440_Chr15g0611421 [Helianthus annuus]
MLELNLSIRFVAFLFLFLSSTCFTSLVQSVCNRSNDLVCLYYAEQRNNLASNFLYINTNTSTSNVLNYNPNRIPSKIMYKKMHKRDANLTSAVWIRRQKKILDSRALRQKKILDSRAFRNKSRTTPLPENQQRLRHRDLHRRPIPAATVHLPLNSLTLRCFFYNFFTQFAKIVVLFVDYCV